MGVVIFGKVNGSSENKCMFRSTSVRISYSSLCIFSVNLSTVLTTLQVFSAFSTIFQFGQMTHSIRSLGMNKGRRNEKVGKRPVSIGEKLVF